MDTETAKAVAKRGVMHSTMHVLRRIVDRYDGVTLPEAPEEDFDDVLVLINLAVIKLDAIDAHPSGQPDLAAIDRRHLEVVR